MEYHTGTKMYDILYRVATNGLNAHIDLASNLLQDCLTKNHPCAKFCSIISIYSQCTKKNIEIKI